MRALTLSALFMLSCGGAVDGSSPVVLGALDADLLSNARSLVFSFSKTQSCSSLVNLSPAEIDDVLEHGGEAAPLQVLAAASDEYVFGNLAPDVPIAYFVLASARAKPPLAETAFSDFTGTVFAIGCRDFVAPSGARTDLPITLFPIGLR